MTCHGVTGQPSCIEKNPHLVSLDLADLAESDTALTVDILIRADYYWEIVEGEIVCQV